MAWIRTDSDEGREEAMRIIGAEMETVGGIEIRFGTTLASTTFGRKKPPSTRRWNGTDPPLPDL
jgi:hypothetical protein